MIDIALYTVSLLTMVNKPTYNWGAKPCGNDPSTKPGADHLGMTVTVYQFANWENCHRNSEFPHFKW